MAPILKRRIGQINFICPGEEDEDRRPFTPGTPLRKCSQFSDIPSSQNDVKDSNKKNKASVSSSCENVSTNNVKVKIRPLVKRSSPRSDLTWSITSNSANLLASLSESDSSCKSDRGSSLAKSIVESRKEYTQLFLMEKAPSFPAKQKTNKTYEKQKPKPSSIYNTTAPDKRNNNITSPDDKKKKSKNKYPNSLTRTIYRKASSLIVSAFFQKAAKNESKASVKKSATALPPAKSQSGKKDVKPVKGAPIKIPPPPIKAQSGKKVDKPVSKEIVKEAPVKIPPQKEAPVPIPTQTQEYSVPMSTPKQGAPSSMPPSPPKPMNQRPCGCPNNLSPPSAPVPPCDDGGVSLCKDKNGAICFKVPGRVLHKTTIRITHIPQGGQEIVNIEDPFNYAKRPDFQAVATKKFQGSPVTAITAPATTSVNPNPGPNYS